MKLPESGGRCVRCELERHSKCVSGGWLQEWFFWWPGGEHGLTPTVPACPGPSRRRAHLLRCVNDGAIELRRLADVSGAPNWSLRVAGEDVDLGFALAECDGLARLAPSDGAGVYPELTDLGRDWLEKHDRAEGLMAT